MGTMTLDGVEYVVIPKADYLRLTDGKGCEVDAVTFTRVELGKNLKAAREHAGLTQAELASKIKKDQSTVSASESGRIGVGAAYVKAVLKACKLPADWRAP